MANTIFSNPSICIIIELSSRIEYCLQFRFFEDIGMVNDYHRLELTPECFPNVGNCPIFAHQKGLTQANKEIIKRPRKNSETDFYLDFTGLRSTVIKLLQVAKCSLLPQSAQNTKLENIPCRSVFVGRRLCALNSCTRSKTASSTIVSWVLRKIACFSESGGRYRKAYSHS